MFRDRVRESLARGFFVEWADAITLMDCCDLERLAVTAARAFSSAAPGLQRLTLMLNLSSGDIPGHIQKLNARNRAHGLMILK